MKTLAQLARRICRGSRHGRAKLTEAIVADIKKRLNDGEVGSALAREYGVTRAAICEIKGGRNWGHVAPADGAAMTKQQAMAYLRARVTNKA